ncbi:MAG: SPOR domain-containing protein [Candidatus Dactylopiibacterium sp.]|nr:SPOR domain-containing protein [Candidatus Dactylopiibacterium sp.]
MSLNVMSARASWLRVGLVCAVAAGLIVLRAWMPEEAPFSRPEPSAGRPASDAAALAPLANPSAQTSAVQASAPAAPTGTALSDEAPGAAASSPAVAEQSAVADAPAGAPLPLTPYVDAGSFARPEEAKALLRRLRQAGVGYREVIHVQIGPFRTPEELQDAQSRLQRAGIGIDGAQASQSAP